MNVSDELRGQRASRLAARLVCPRFSLMIHVCATLFQQPYVYLDITVIIPDYIAMLDSVRLLSWGLT